MPGVGTRSGGTTTAERPANENGRAFARPCRRVRVARWAGDQVVVVVGAVEMISFWVSCVLLKPESVIEVWSLSVMTVLLPTVAALENATAAALVP